MKRLNLCAIGASIIGIAALLSAASAQSLQVKQSSTTGIRFLLVSSSDGSTPVTGASPTVTICKAGTTSFVSPAGSVRELGNGVYELVPAAGDTSINGPLELNATAAGAIPYTREVQIVAYDPSDGAALGLTGVSGGPAATLAAIKADSSFDALLNTRKGIYTYNASTKVITLYKDNGTSVVGTVTLTTNSSGVILSRQ